MHTPDVLAILAKLPPRCFVEFYVGYRGPRVIEIVRGVPDTTDDSTGLTADALNAALPTCQQIEAMLYGAVHGWHLPGTDADLAGEAAVKRQEHLSIMAPSLADEP
jgi:hypothetical protein